MIKAKEKFKQNSLLKKIIFLFIFTILLQIPLFFIKGIINERNYFYNEMTEEIGNEWGKRQTISGPFLVIPYDDGYIEKTYENDKPVEIKKYRQGYYIVLPDKLNTDINLKDEIRQRGIYKSTVYTGNIKIKGYFPDLRDVLPANINPYEVYVALGISDTKSILKIDSFKVGSYGESVELESGTGVDTQNVLSTGISGNLSRTIFEQNSIPFDIDITLRGNEGIDILPFGKENYFKVSSSWNSPSFYGMLPIERNITDSGFTAEWNISHLVRNYKQDFSASYMQNLSDGKAGVNLYEGITHYRQVTRAVKYGMLFIMLSLFVVYLFEISSKKFTHYIQYGVVGFSLTLFYLLLLSLSEYFNFEIAYIIATLAVIIPNSLYIKSVTKNKKYGVGMFIFLSGVYAVLFSILKMEQYALLTGTILIMVVLYVMMYLTRNMDIFMEKEFEDKDNNLEE